MTVLVHSKTLTVTDSIRGYANRQIGKLSKYSKKVQGVNVFLDTIRTSRGTNQEASVKVHVVVPGKDVVVKSKASDLYLAISQAMEDAARHLRKRKERLIERRRPEKTWAK